MAQEPTYLIVEFYREAGPYYSDAMNAKTTEDRLIEAGKDFKAVLEKAGFRGEIDLSVTGQAAMIGGSDELVRDLARGLPYTTFVRKLYA